MNNLERIQVIFGADERIGVEGQRIDYSRSDGWRRGQCQIRGDSNARSTSQLRSITGSVDCLGNRGIEAGRICTQRGKAGWTRSTSDG